MIGTEDMSTSAGMDISESFRAEDLSKTDFFDFVTAPDMGIGIGVGVGVDVGVGVSLHHHTHQQQQPAQHSHNSMHQQTSQSQQQLCGTRANASSMTHDGGGNGGAGSGRNGHNNNGGDPTLQGYEFWHSDKDGSRLDSSSIFEDLDRYCWQQQPVTASASSSNGRNGSNANHPSPTSPLGTHPQHQQQQQQHQQTAHHQPSNINSPAGASSSASVAGGNGSGGGGGGGGGGAPSGDTISNIDNTDGQIYTLTVLNGSEPWLKRAEAEQLPSALDLDSLLGSFPGYIKSEYPYDDSGFTDGTKDVIVNGGGPGSDANGLSSLAHSSQHGQTLPSLVTAISIAGSGNSGVADLGQQLAQFQNNNNDWHMADHNAEQNSAESLLRSALQGKGYTKGLHMQNGIAMMPGSPSVKDEDMRRLLFTPDAADALGFADSTLSSAQMFEDAQSLNHAGAHLLGTSASSASGHAQHNGNGGGGGGMPSIIVDDMFLSLENAFSDDFEKIKRIANEVQQFCNAGTPTSGDFGGGGGSNDVLMQISPSATASSANQLQPPQPLKPEVSTSTATTTSAATTGAGAVGRLTGVSKPKKQYKRTSSSNSSGNNNNNNNPHVLNHNNNAGTVLGVVMGSTSNSSSGGSSGSASSSSNSPPANCNGTGGGGGGGGGGTVSGGGASSGQRKERSLHYCSICSKGFKDKYSVNVHIRTHTGEKPFACSLCGKSFRQKAHLAKHYQTHMTQKNNGSLIKGSGSKHQRSSAAANSNNNSNNTTTAQQQRQLSSVATSIPNLGGVMSSGVVLNSPNAAHTGVLPPANGLLTNR
ncbi:uncharacterized transmembrane protein DDB_G0289901 [Scaptodrosophila lebanonensis]|uniref:Uncharacterized transmembrane protein DDB_G0289901 n=1 Tax=Drosophila lebanonensis TaxID=7225 RepID=A0A6J2T2T7_DROLE|nr:uncharacterized transmembrane protein DDB_G0289901 [Scaptodrosophila lebanonensis]